MKNIKKVILGMVFLFGVFSVDAAHSYQNCLQEAWEQGTEYGWDDYSRWYFTNSYANSCDRGLEDGLYE